MEYPPKECTCITDISIDFNVEIANEDLEEIDEDELVEHQPISHKIIWQEISDEFDDKRRQIEEFKNSKLTDCEKLLNPNVQFLEDNIFPLLKQILVDTINKANELEVIKHQKSAFNGVDFIAEELWNLNPRHTERKQNWTYIFDMDWVEESLSNKSRPYYPFSWIWSKEYAATLIQAAVRGHWVRCRKDVEEMRQFWKILAIEKIQAQLQEAETEHCRPSVDKIPKEAEKKEK